MRRFYYASGIIALVATLFLQSPTLTFAQGCGCAGVNYSGANVAGWVVGQTQTSWCVDGGERFPITNTVNGAVYRFSTCGTSWDTQLSIYTNPACGFLGYNDDNGPACSGLSASINITSAGGNMWVKVNEFNCNTNSTCGTLLVQLISLPATAPVGCTIAAESNPFFTAASGCTDGSVSLGSGAFHSFSITPNTYYVFTWNNSTGGNVNGFCATSNGSGGSFTSNQTCWYSGSSNSITVSANRSSSTWSTFSAQMTYRHTTPTLTGNLTGATTICTGGSVSITGGTASCGVRYWQGSNASGTSTATTGSPNTVSPTSTNTYYYRPGNNGCWGTAQGTTITVVSDPTLSGATLDNGTICVGGSTIATSNLSGGTGTQIPTWQYFNGSHSSASICVEISQICVRF